MSRVKNKFFLISLGPLLDTIFSLYRYLETKIYVVRNFFRPDIDYVECGIRNGSAGQGLPKKLCFISMEPLARSLHLRSPHI